MLERISYALIWLNSNQPKTIFRVKLNYHATFHYDNTVIIKMHSENTSIESSWLSR